MGKAEIARIAPFFVANDVPAALAFYRGVEPVPNYTRDVKKGIARWDAYLDVPDPDGLAAAFMSRDIEGLRGFEVKDAVGYVLLFGRPRPEET